MGKHEMKWNDLGKLLSTRYANGADFWATPEGKLGIERPISTLTALLIMSDLKVPRDHEALQGAANLVLTACQADGRVKISPRGSVYPCQTAIAAAALCRNGYTGDSRVQLMLNHLLGNRFDDGGWRCKKFLYGRGPETDHSNPGVTLFAMDAFRCTGKQDEIPDLNRAVETLLAHWDSRLPIGPCHYGMGTLFMQVEYPFLRYNLFYYTYVLSFYAQARLDSRFRKALQVLQSKMDHQGRLIVERPNKKLAGLDICLKGQPSAAATERYQEIVTNLAMSG